MPTLSEERPSHLSEVSPKKFPILDISHVLYTSFCCYTSTAPYKVTSRNSTRSVNIDIYWVTPAFYCIITLCFFTYRVSQEERSIFWEAIIKVSLSKNFDMNVCPIRNGFRDRAILLYNCKIVDKKEILRVRTVSNTGIYCASDRVGRGV